MKIVQGLRDWRRFGRWLHLPSDKLDAINKQHNPRNRLYAVVQEWFKGRKESWRWFIFALDKAGQSALADPIRRYAEPPPGILCDYCLMLYQTGAPSC